MNDVQVGSSRISFLDELRGLCVLMMIIYHGLYDLVMIFGMEAPWFWSFGMRCFQVSIGISFIFISGISSRFSHNNLKRGLICFGIGMALTLITAVFLPDQVIYFGVLHFLGAAMIIYHFAEKLLIRIPMIWGAMGGILLFVLTFGINDGFMGIGSVGFSLPNWLYRSTFLIPLGFPTDSFYSSDYYAILPWIFLFVAGTFVGAFVKSHSLPDWLYRIHVPALNFVGCHSLIIYVLHQPIIYGIFYFLFVLV